MRELVYYVATSIDGFIAREDGDFSDFLAEGDHFDVVFGEYTDALPQPALDALGLTPTGTVFDTVLMGRATYDVGARVGLSDPYPHLRQFVFTDTPIELPGHITRVGSADALDVVRKLTAETGASGIWLCGGGRLASALSPEIDRLILKVNPIVFGRGIPLFGDPSGDRQRAPWHLDRSRAFSSGVHIDEYTPAHRGETERSAAQ